MYLNICSMIYMAIKTKLIYLKIILQYIDTKK